MNLSETSVMVIVGLAAAVCIVAFVCFAVVGAIAYKKGTPDAHRAFNLLLKQSMGLLAIAMIVLSAFVLSLVGKLNEAAVVGLLSGISGFVLGRGSNLLGRRQRQEPPAGAE